MVSCNDEERGQLCRGSTASSRREESGGAWVQVHVGGMWMYRLMVQWESDGVVMITRRPHRRAGISRGAAKGRKRHDSGPYIGTMDTYIRACGLLDDSQVLTSPLERYGIESPLTPPNLVFGLPLSHTPMPHTNIAILPCRTSQSWQRRGPNGADSPTQLSSARPSTTHQFNHFKSIPYLP